MGQKVTAILMTKSEFLNIYFLNVSHQFTMGKSKMYQLKKTTFGARVINEICLRICNLCSEMVEIAARIFF